MGSLSTLKSLNFVNTQSILLVCKIPRCNQTFSNPKLHNRHQKLVWVGQPGCSPCTTQKCPRALQEISKPKITLQNRIFEHSKKCIIDAIQEGVKIFDITRRTCLRTDWSKKGIGYFLSQKHCDCTSREFGCCENGWRITLAGSRFPRDSEDDYAPIEGEGLAVAWSLEQTKFFTLGCNDLKVITDHKPLIPIFNKRRLDEIENTRLLRIKKRTLRWRFDIGYVPGILNPFSNAISRNPCGYVEVASFSVVTTRGHYCWCIDRSE